MNRTTETHADQPESSAAAGPLPPWGTADLPNPPGGGVRLWIGMLGPGVVMAGTAIGTGEWLAGPSMTAQYGGALLWLASISIILQVFTNLVIVQYAMYCGEPLLVGALRTKPGPWFWIACYLLLDLAVIWPYSSANAAVALVAAIRGHFPDKGDTLLKVMSISLYLAAFVPLIFGGTVYRMLEKVMIVKLAYVLGFLLFVTVFFVSWPVIKEAATGFVSVGTVPLRAETVVSGVHFSISERVGNATYLVRGTGEQVFEFRKDGVKRTGPLSAELQVRRDALMGQAKELAQPGRFYVDQREDGLSLAAAGTIAAAGAWRAEKFTVTEGGAAKEYTGLDEVPEAYRDRFRQLVEHKGSEHANILTYVGKHESLPPLDWATLAVFCAFAGAGGLTNAMLSNWARDKGWGMGARVGAIPSAVAGRTIPLSPAGKVFPADAENLSKWRGWVRHAARDQVGLWMIASFIGMALPCMLSLEFIRNATVEGNRVAAMNADGMAARFPEWSTLLWSLTLLCGFMILFPCQISLGDQVSRRWTDIIWSISPSARALGSGRVEKLYYTILATFAAGTLIPVTLQVMEVLDPLDFAKISGFLSNVALAFSALLAVYVNHLLMPRHVRAPWYLQVGTLLCSAFYFGISGIVLYYTLKEWIS